MVLKLKTEQPRASEIRAPWEQFTTMTQPTIRCYLSLGGNIGDPAIAIDDALTKLASLDKVEVKTRSPFYRTAPWGVIDQPAFVNACAEIETSLSALDLLNACLNTENQMGRERREKWGPRIIDIDILTYGSEQISQPRLTIPHPHMMERAFVLVPLSDIAPDLIIGGQSIFKALSKLDKNGVELLEGEIENSVI